LQKAPAPSPASGRERRREEGKREKAREKREKASLAISAVGDTHRKRERPGPEAREESGLVIFFQHHRTATGTRLCFLSRFPLKKMHDVIRFWRLSSSFSEPLQEGCIDHQCRRFVRFLHKHLCLFFFLGCATFPTVLRQFFGSNVVHFDNCGVLADANIGDFLWSTSLLTEAVCGFNIDLLWRIDLRCSYP
jgi:hypothetical protein